MILTDNSLDIFTNFIHSSSRKLSIHVPDTKTTAEIAVSKSLSLFIYLTQRAIVVSVLERVKW